MAATASRTDISSPASTSSGFERRLVGVVDAGEPGELPGARLGVEALGVALLAHLDRRVDEHLEEHEAGRVVQRAGVFASGPVRADQRHQRDHAGVGEQPRDLADAPHVLGAVVGGEPEVAVEPVAEVVAVERVGRARDAR